jgi:hypothetical protein
MADDDISNQLFEMAMENKAIKLFIYSYAFFNALTIILLLTIVSFGLRR